MARRKQILSLFFLGVCACDAGGAPPASNPPSAQAPAAASSPASTLYCKLDAGKAQVCRMEIKTEPGDAANVTLTFTLESGSMRFKGQHQSAWWSGRLNDKPAMGYELNRGHTIYSTSDLSTTFEWWYGDMEHGNY